MTLRVLVDVNLSPDWVPVLNDAGFEAMHWVQVGDLSAPDREIMEWAVAKGYLVFSHDLVLLQKSGGIAETRRGGRRRASSLSRFRRLQAEASSIAEG